MVCFYGVFIVAYHNQPGNVNQLLPKITDLEEFRESSVFTSEYVHSLTSALKKPPILRFQAVLYL